LNAFVFLICENFKSHPVSIVINPEDQEDGFNNVLLEFLKEYEITNNEGDKIPTSRFEKAYFKKLKLELEGIKIAIRKNNSRDNLKDKMCIFGVKKRDKVEDEDVTVNIKDTFIDENDDVKIMKHEEKELTDEDIINNFICKYQTMTYIEYKDVVKTELLKLNKMNLYIAIINQLNNR
jgi:hypothetical protein